MPLAGKMFHTNVDFLTFVGEALMNGRLEYLLCEEYYSS